MTRHFYYGWIVVAAAFLAELLAFGIAYSFGVFFKPLCSELGWSRTIIAGVFGVYAITHDLLAPLTGWACDRFDPRLPVAVGGFCLGLSMFLMSRVTAIWQVYLLYGFVFALGVASIYAPLMALVSQWFTKKRGIAMGIVAAGIGAGSLIFNPLSAWLISSYDMSTTYVIIGAVCWILFIPITKFVRKAPTLDTASTTVQEEGVFTGGFTRAEALKTRAFWMVSFSWLFMALALWAVSLHLVNLLTDKGIPVITAASVAGVIGGVSIVGRLSGGFLSDKVGRKSVILIGFILQLIGTSLFLFSGEVWEFFLSSGVFGLGAGLWCGTMPCLPADLYGAKATGSIFGLMVLFAGVGIALGPIAGGYIFDVTSSYTYMMWMCICSIILSIVFVVLMKPPVKDAKSKV